MKKFDKIYVEITNICNLNCKFCDNISRDKAFITIKDFKIIIDKIKEYTKAYGKYSENQIIKYSNKGIS